MEESFKKLVESLSPIERGLLPFIKEEFLDINNISKSSSLDLTTSIRAAGFLKNKSLIEIDEKEKKIVDLGVLGINYLKKHLPERILLNRLSEKRTIPISEIKSICNLNDNEAKVALGTLKKKALVEVKEGKVFLNASESEISKKMLEELFLEKLPLNLDSLEPQDKLAFENLKSRKEIIQIESKKTVLIKLTELGKKISKEDLKDNLIEQLTPKILKQNTWRGKKFRRYDLTSQVPRIYGGKRHFVNQATEYAKSIWLEMGFKEMSGDYTVSGFWNFDALFTAQDHPARELHDTFFIKDIKAQLLDKKIVNNVKKAHEVGVDGSIGWQESWKEEDAKKVLLRTHTTCLSSQTLSKLNVEDLPAKFFAVGKCFRNDTVDWSHGFEFNQTEGIVIDENANLCQLLGYLRKFAEKMGYKKVRFRPHYFPYTEPSLEGDVWNEERGCWMEVFAAGIFRPEVTEPLLGKPIPILAWGPGFDRMLMMIYGISDMRELYKNDINKLRDIKFWMK